MSGFLSKFKKLRGRSTREIGERSRQSVSAFAESIGFAGGLPSDAEFRRLLGKNFFGRQEPTAEFLLENFQKSKDVQFFASFDDKEKTLAVLREYFGASSERRIIERASRAIEGKFDLLGYKNLDFGVPVDWHLEPISGTRSPLKHWKKFDELNGAETGDKKIVWELNRHQHFFDLGAAYWLTGDERFAAAFVMHLSSWMEQNPTAQGINWVSSLEVGLRAISWLWALHFFKNSPNLTPTVFNDALKFLYAHARHIEKYLSTFYSPNTHLTGEALALYYLGVLLPIFTCSARWRETGTRILLEELDKQLFADGVYFEQTTWYQRYTVDYYTHFLILSELNQIKLSSAEHWKLKTKLQLALDFLMYATRPDGTTPLIGDDDGGQMLPRGGAAAVNDFRGALSNGALLFNRGDYKFAAQKLSEESFWLLGAETARKFEQIEAREPRETSKYFPHGGYFVMRDGWTPNANFLLIDGGKHGALSGGHAHADALAFELAVGGRTLLIDAGTYTYHESETDRNYFRSTQAHNTLTVDNQSSSEDDGKFSWKIVADAHTESHINHHRFDFFAAWHEGFSRLEKSSKKTARHTRSVLFLRDNYWIFYDDVNISGEHDYELNFHFAPDIGIEIGSDGEFVFVPPSENEKCDGLKIFLFGDNGEWRVRGDEIAPCYGLRVPAWTAAFASRGMERQEFFTFLLPSSIKHENLSVKEITANGGRGFVVDFGEFQDWLIYGDGDWVENELFGSNFRFAWARFERATLDLSDLVLVGGSRFVFNEAEILNLGKTSSHVYARRVNDVLSFENLEHGLDTLLTPNLTYG